MIHDFKLRKENNKSVAYVNYQVRRNYKLLDMCIIIIIYWVNLDIHHLNQEKCDEGTKNIKGWGDFDKQEGCVGVCGGEIWLLFLEGEGAIYSFVPEWFL